MVGSEYRPRHHAVPSVLVDGVTLEYSFRGGAVRALDDVVLTVCEGEFVGLVGRNGSGKSSLLRTIAGVETPRRGRVYATSQPMLVGVNAALIGDLTGAENITLGALALGMTPREVEQARPGIEELAGIGDAICRPMRTYSSGMAARLRFAISRAARPDILLVDEALSTGDAAFAERSRRAMDEMLEDSGTVFLVSHAAQTIEELCSRAIWLDEGRVIVDGPAREVARLYRWYAHVLAQGDEKKAAGILADASGERGLSHH